MVEIGITESTTEGHGTNCPRNITRVKKRGMKGTANGIEIVIEIVIEIGISLLKDSSSIEAWEHAKSEIDEEMKELNRVYSKALSYFK
jgi:hypothetical protein